MSPLPIRRAGLALAAVAWLVVAGVTACADGLTSPSGSLSLALTPTALRLAAGRADSVSVRLLRGGGFDGAIALSIEPPAAAPASLAVTLDAVSLPFPASESVVRVAAAAGTPPGRYVYDVRATGQGGAMTASRTIAVTVEAAAVPGPLCPRAHDVVVICSPP